MHTMWVLIIVSSEQAAERDELGHTAQVMQDSLYFMGNFHGQFSWADADSQLLNCHTIITITYVQHKRHVF